MRFPLLFVVTTAMLEKSFGNAIHARVFVLPLLQYSSVISDGRISRISSFFHKSSSLLSCANIKVCILCQQNLFDVCRHRSERRWMRGWQGEGRFVEFESTVDNFLWIEIFIRFLFDIFFHLHFTGLTPLQLFALLHLIISMDSQTQLSLAKCSPNRSEAMTGAMQATKTESNEIVGIK